jgi:hypothetical protein
MLGLRGPLRKWQKELSPRWCCVLFINDNVVHVFDDKKTRWQTACGADIMEKEYSRRHPQMVNCLGCIVAMGSDEMYMP